MPQFKYWATENTFVFKMAEDPEDLSWVLEADKKLKCKANKRLPNAESSLPGLNKFKVLSESSNIETACTPSSHSSSKLSQAEISGKYSVLKIQQDKNQDILRKLKLVKCHKKKVSYLCFLVLNFYTKICVG